MDQLHRIVLTLTRRHANLGITLSDEEAGENARSRRSVRFPDTTVEVRSPRIKAVLVRRAVLSSSPVLERCSWDLGLCVRGRLGGSVLVTGVHSEGGRMVTLAVRILVGAG